jgi:hypothetical protein
MVLGDYNVFTGKDYLGTGGSQQRLHVHLLNPA